MDHFYQANRQCILVSLKRISIYHLLKHKTNLNNINVIYKNNQVIRFSILQAV